MNNTGYILIEKEFISNIRWCNDDIDTSSEEKENLMGKIFTACILGNSEKHKCIIKFKTGRKAYQTETTIWSYCPETIVLKYGITIPLCKIVDVVI